MQADREPNDGGEGRATLAAYAFDVFVAHEPRSGAALAAAVKLQLQEAWPAGRVFVGSNEPAAELDDAVDRCRSLVLLVTEGVLASREVLSQLRRAIHGGKRVALLHDDSSCPFPSLTEVPPDLRELFAIEQGSVLYRREAQHRQEAMRQLIDALNAAAADSGAAGRPAATSGLLPQPPQGSPAQAWGPSPKTASSRLRTLVGPGESIASALRSARPGDTIALSPGWYEEQLVLEKDVGIVGPREAVLSFVEGPALYCAGPAAPSVRGITIRGAADKQPAVLVASGSRLSLVGCDVRSAKSSGIVILGEGTAPVVSSCCVHECGGAGVLVQSGASGVVEGNEIKLNALAGVEIKTGASPVVRGNKVSHSKQSGIVARDGARGTIEGNDISANAKPGISIKTGADPVVRGNTIRGQAYGILVSAGGRGTISGNTLRDISDPAYARCNGVRVKEDSIGAVVSDNVLHNAPVTVFPVAHADTAVPLSLSSLQPPMVKAKSVRECTVKPGMSITQAINSVLPGGTVVLSAGRYKEQVLLDRDVHIVGPSDAVIEWDESFVVHCCSPDSPSVRGITIRGTGASMRAVWITDGSRATLRDCVVSCCGLGQSNPAVLVEGPGTAPTLKGNVVRDCAWAGVLFTTAAKGVVEGNEFSGNAHPAIVVMNGADPTLIGNKISDQAQGILVSTRRTPPPLHK